MSAPSVFPLPRHPESHEKIVKATDLKEGDLVDLEGGPYFKDNSSIKFEYGEVSGLERETDHCLVVFFEGIGGGAYHPDQEFLLQVQDQ